MQPLPGAPAASAGAGARAVEDPFSNPAPWAIGLAAAGVVLVGLFPETLLDQSVRSILALLGR